jgi:hypothetical protein
MATPMPARAEATQAKPHHRAMRHQQALMQHHRNLLATHSIRRRRRVSQCQARFPLQHSPANLASLGLARHPPTRRRLSKTTDSNSSSHTINRPNNISNLQHTARPRVATIPLMQTYRHRRRLMASQGTRGIVPMEEDHPQYHTARIHMPADKDTGIRSTDSRMHTLE